MKEISLKRSQPPPNNYRPAKKPHSARKKKRVKQNDIMAMIYPSTSYQDSLSLAVSEVEHTLRSGGAGGIRKGMEATRKAEMKKAAQRIKEY